MDLKKNAFWVFMPILIAASLLLAGCVAQQTPAPTPAATATPLPTATATPTPAPTSTPEPTVEITPEQKLAMLKSSTALVLQQVFGGEFVFSQDKDPVSGAITYFAAGSDNYYNIQVAVAKGIGVQWPPTKTLAEKRGESGLKKTVVFTQTNFQQPLVETEFEMECNNFAQTVKITLNEQNTPALPFKNLADNVTRMLIDSCP